MNPAELATKLPPRLGRWWKELSGGALAYGLDVYLLAAIMDRESLGGEALKPPNSAGTGDRGHGHGLMQIDSGSHRDFLVALFDDGVPLWTDPAFNVLYAARLLHRNLATLGGDYVPAVAAYNAGLSRVRRALLKLPKYPTPQVKLATVDALTTGKDYVSDVLRRRAKFTSEALV